jgi:glucans biosynthesis protein
LDRITRRRLIQGSAALASSATTLAASEPFIGSTVRRAAQDLAKQPFREPDTKLPGAAASMTYDQYRGIRFKQDRALWRGQDLPFQISFFPRGFLYRPVVDIYEVRDRQAMRVPYSPDLFDYDDPSVRVPDALGFAGFRVHAPINKPGEFDEFCVFLGASYFRAVGRGQSYGLSARGLAIGTGALRPEEFPRFRAFWLERPQPRGNTLVIHALLDSRSTTGAFRFTVRPGDTTVMDVESIVFPRTAIQEVGVAALTSMYYFSGRDHARPDAVRPDDWRAAVHDSDGLGVANGRNERLWRPLVNPTAVQFSAFMDANPRGFGLMQRKRAFTDFGDLQELYGRRPSLWIEPIGDWGVGAVDLVEIPTNSEYNDNIVAFWRGTEPLRAGGEYNFTYRMHWGADAPLDARLARIVEMRTGAGTAPGTRVFVLDLIGDAVKTLATDAKTWVELGSSAGRIREGYSGPNPETGGWRISIEFDPAGAPAADLRCALRGDQGVLTETWLYRWIA